MAKPTTITKEMIIEAAFEIVSEGGLKMLSARNVAKKIGCSTQPIYWTYKNMDMLKHEVIAKVEMYMTHKMSLYEKHEYPSLNIGMGYIFLAYKEPMLFKEYYVDNIKNINIKDLIPIDIWKNAEGDSTNEIMQDPLIQKWMLIHGIATLIMAGAMEYNEQVIEKILIPLFE